MSRLPKYYVSSSEYQSLMYILSGNRDTSSHINDLFDFDKIQIKPYSYANHSWQTSGSLKAVRIAYNLFNNNRLNGFDEDDPRFNDLGDTILDIFSDSQRELFLRAILVRFNRAIKIEK